LPAFLTAARERLFNSLTPNFEDIDAALASFGDLRDKPGGTVRINSAEHAARTILWPVLRKLLPGFSLLVDALRQHP
jgi:DNA-binding transcriptional LysR family regulator